MTNLCNIDGRISPEASASVSVLDRGFLFGDSVYEVLRTHHGKLLAMDLHLKRLHASAERIALELPLDDAKLEARIRETVAAADNTESYVRIIVTRGTVSRPDIDPDCTMTPPTVILLVRALPELDPALLERGYRAWLVATRRNDRRSLDPAIKSGNYLNNILGLMEAKKHGAQIAIFLNPAGQLSEAQTANVWIVRGTRIETPFLSAGILPGITRALLLEIAQRDGLDLHEAELGEADLRAADEVFVSSTIRDVAPITSLDGAPIGDGKPGPVTMDLRRRLLAYCDSLVDAN